MSNENKINVLYKGYVTRDLTKLQMYAHHKGIKTLYYIRQKNKAQEECLSCAV